MTAIASPSEYQIAIFDAVEQAIEKMLSGEKPNSLLIEAKPGSGKTTTGVAATHRIPKTISTMFVAFNKKIATELAARLPPSIPARTFHAHWLRQWGRYVREHHGCSVEINNYKIRNAVEKHFKINRSNRQPRKGATPDQIRAHRQKLELINDVVFLVEKAKLYGVVPQGYAAANSVGEFTDNNNFWWHIIDYFAHPIEPAHYERAVEAARHVLAGQLENETEVDFLDMLYLPAVNGVKNEQSQIVMIDEAQDLNELQRYLLSRMVTTDGMVIAIGDRRQCIFSFVGADAESMDRIKEEFNCAEYPLSISYRCARQIVNEAYQIFPEIEAAPNAAEGSVERPEKWDIEDFRPGHLVICRNNSPTIALAYRLIRHRIPAKVLGREIGEGLIRLVKTLDEDNSLAELIENLRVWRDHQLTIVERKKTGNDRAKEQICDKYDCVANLATSESIRTVADLVRVLEELFVDPNDKGMVSPTRVTLSTIHKIKGAEADTVFLLDPHLINPPWIQSEWQKEQEVNLLFVAVTRAKKRLVFLTSEAIKSK